MSSMVLVLIAFLFVAVFLCWGIIPSGLTCFTALCFLWFTGVLDLNAAFGNFVSGSVITMIAMMVVTAGLLRTNLLRHIVRLTTTAKGGGIRILLLVSMLVPFLLCQFTGGVTALITVIPLLLALADAANVPHTSLILPASIGAQLGVALFPVGMSASMFMLKNQILANCGTEAQFGYWDLCFTRLPGAVASMTFILFVGYKFLPKREVTLSDDQKGELKESTLTPGQEKVAYGIFILTMLGMIFNSLIPLNLYQVGVLGALAMVFSGILSERDAFNAVSWPTIFMVASMLGVINGLTSSGVGDILGEYAAKIINGDNSTFMICAVCFIICVVLTQVMDNTTIVNVLTPVAVMACMKSGVNPLPVCAAIEVSSITSIMTPMASPSTAMTYSMGGYTIKEMAKFCIPVILVQTIVTLAWLPIYYA